MGEKVICFDLDDTLSKEIDYLKSAYKEIVQYAIASCKACSMREVLFQEAYEVMLKAYKNGENAFDHLNVVLGVQTSVSNYLNIYRNHEPEITLAEEVESVLSALKGKGYVLGLITDGRSIQQRHKIDALKLERFFKPDNTIISEEFGSEKPCESNYLYFMHRYPSAEFTYVGDNPKKDFLGANALGWQTFCLLDDGRNIHRQDFEKYSEEYQPLYKIHSLKELLAILCKNSTSD